MQPYEEFLKRAPKPLQPFELVLVRFCEALSRVLFAHPKIMEYPDMAALAFWLRSAQIARLKEAFEKASTAHQRLVPRGCVFHIAPANVETMFVYSWILSLLVGNVNMVRLPSKESEGLKLLFEAINSLLQQKEFAPIQATTCLLRYGHEEEVTATISQQVDVRVIWGGDETIRAIRRIPLKAQAKEITFADRFALAVIDAKAYLAASEGEKDRLVHAFYNDVFWYDQMACSSPRALFWVGSAPEDFYQRLQHHLEVQKYRLPLALVLSKETYLFEKAVDMEMRSVDKISNELILVQVEKFDPRCRNNHCGSGLLYVTEIADIHELDTIVNDKDQTLTYYGAAKDQLKGLKVDRIVPVGQALQFDYIWDGYNMLTELTKTRFTG